MYPFLIACSAGRKIPSRVSPLEGSSKGFDSGAIMWPTLCLFSHTSPRAWSLSWLACVCTHTIRFCSHFYTHLIYGVVMKFGGIFSHHKRRTTTTTKKPTNLLRSSLRENRSGKMGRRVLFDNLSHYYGNSSPSRPDRTSFRKV